MKKKTENMRAIWCAANVSAAIIATTASADIVIDEFTDIGTPDPWPLNVSGTDLATAFETGLTDVLGGQRATLLRGIDNGAGAENGLGIFASIDPSGSGVLNYNSSPDSDGALNLTYGGVPNPLNTDFSAEGGIVVEFAELLNPLAGDDGGGLMDLIVVVTLEDSDTSAEHSITVQQPGAASLFFAFSQFTGLGELDLTNVDVVLVEFRATGGTQFQADRIFATIPTPGALALLAIGLTTPRRRR